MLYVLPPRVRLAIAGFVVSTMHALLVAVAVLPAASVAVTVNTHLPSYACAVPAARVSVNVVFVVLLCVGISVKFVSAAEVPFFVAAILTPYGVAEGRSVLSSMVPLSESVPSYPTYGLTVILERVGTA